MKKSLRKMKKLRLSRETVRLLESETLQTVKGGSRVTDTCTIPNSACNSCYPTGACC